jgi:hypothetical protein
MEIKTLSSFPGVPFNDTFETFFDSYELDEEIECYQLVFSPYGDKNSFDDLYQINFKSRVVILNILDSIIDECDNIAIEELTEFCLAHPEQNFIVFNFHLGIRNQLELPNLYFDTILSANPVEKLNHCEKKEISNRWLSLNADTKLHRVMAVSYLLSKEYCENGDISFNMNSPTLVKYDQYKNITKIPNELKDNFSKGFKKFKSRDFNLLNIPNFDEKNERVANNYNVNLMPVYQNIGVEIITGTMFFEKNPLLTEKEIQSVYAKNFPIYINAPGMAREMKKLLDIDLFEDIIDHSYDEIDDHFERLAAAIDRNENLLNGSTNIQELWYDNQKRFEENCKKLDSIIYDKRSRKAFNHNKIKKALTHFQVSFVKN